MYSVYSSRLNNNGENLAFYSPDGFSVVVFANPTTGSFTILERKAIDTYCAIVIGIGFEPVPKEIQDDIRQQQEKSKL